MVDGEILEAGVPLMGAEHSEGKNNTLVNAESR